jgi:DHA1 family tetracycline resistance protein-like MFS transporter
MLAGFGFGVLGFGVYGLATTGAAFVSAIPLSALFGLTYPSMQGLLTRQVEPDEQGRLQGAIASLMGVAGILAPLLFTQVFALAIGPASGLGLPGAAFLLAGLLLGVGGVIAGRATRDERR